MLREREAVEKEGEGGELRGRESRLEVALGHSRAEYCSIASEICRGADERERARGRRASGVVQGVVSSTQRLDLTFPSSSSPCSPATPLSSQSYRLWAS